MCAGGVQRLSMVSSHCEFMICHCEAVAHTALLLASSPALGSAHMGPFARQCEPAGTKGRRVQRPGARFFQLVRDGDVSRAPFATC